MSTKTEDILEKVKVNGEIVESSIIDLGLLIEKHSSTINDNDYSKLLTEELNQIVLDQNDINDLLKTLLNYIRDEKYFSDVAAWAIGKSFSDTYNEMLIQVIKEKNIRDYKILKQAIRAAEISDNNILSGHKDFLLEIKEKTDNYDLITIIDEILSNL